MSTHAAADELAAAKARAEVGDAEGHYRLGLVHERGRVSERDLVAAVRHYQRAAEMGHVESQFALGLLFVGAVQGAPADEKKSFDWFASAAKQGHAKAAYFLAMSHESGVGTEANAELAFDWYRRAAGRGERAAPLAIARMYATGAGIQVNLPNAHAWNQVAIARGLEGARSYEAELEARMSEDEIERARTLAKGLLRKYAAGASR
ncbi:MAG: tetratricopeptide repeat protein [Myxococcota bacterium]|nr:tetratricopeptide repeat protein [Myxococcota bacterium]